MLRAAPAEDERALEDRSGPSCFYAVSGLISPLHGTEGAWSDFDLFQHFFIDTDFLCGVGVLGFVAWLVVRASRSRSVQPV